MQFEKRRPPETPNAPYRAARVKDESGARRDRDLNPGGQARGWVERLPRTKSSSFPSGLVLC
jgi:hypothetical protein